ncbi:hypothetical protein [Streptomyces sp. bgisy060]|uniref:hypothetical protein n=1 Tax=Streptomyces sp. bgisy060 TaxID=3413775 RepID=UPI003EBB66CF
MIQPASLAIGFVLGVLLHVLVLRIRPRRTPLPLSIAAPSPALISAMSEAVAERYPYPNLGGFDYATVSVFERDSPEKTVHLYPARGPHRGVIRLDPTDLGSASAMTARLLTEMSLPHVGVLVIPLGPR